MQDKEQATMPALLRDPEMLARLERNLRSAGMPRRRFLAMAGAAAGSAALAACGGGSPTAPPAPTTAPTQATAVSPSAASSPAAVPTAAAVAGPESKKVLI